MSRTHREMCKALTGCDVSSKEPVKTHIENVLD
jgi:hypothetical protein